jgi:hypothetical protein
VGIQVPQYRLYKLNSVGRFVSGDWIEAEDDAGAIEAAHALCDAATPTIEVWQGSRQVAVVPCATEAQATVGSDLA